MSQMRQLYRLQQIDSEIAEKKRALMDVLRAQKANAALISAQQGADEAGRELAKWQKQQKALEMELAGVDSKAKRSEQRLYSGNVKNPKELEDLEHELEALSRRRAILEDEILETMLMVEEANEQNERAVSELMQLEEAWSSRLRNLKSEQTALATRINELMATHNEVVARISPELLTVYQAVGKSTAGVAVSALQQGRCHVCGVGVSEKKRKAVELGELVYCGSCGRILSLP